MDCPGTLNVPVVCKTGSMENLLILKAMSEETADLPSVSIRTFFFFFFLPAKNKIKEQCLQQKINKEQMII